MSARVDTTTGTVRQLDARAGAEQAPTETEVQDPAKLSKALSVLLRDVAALKRRWWPREVYYADLTVDATGTTLYRLNHGFGGLVYYAVVRWEDGTAAPNLRVDSTTTNSVLVLTSTVAGTATVRVWEAG